MVTRWFVVGLSLAAIAGAQTLSADLERIENAERRRPAETNRQPRRFEVLAASAGEAFRQGDKDAAIERFDQAAAEAFRQEAVGAAFEYAVAAAELKRAAGENADAARRFRRAALSAVRDPRAAAAHAAACVAAGEELRVDPTDSRSEAYGELLAEHLSNWPAADTAHAVRERLWQWLRMTSQWQSLLQETDNAATREVAVRLRVAAYDGLLRQTAPDRAEVLAKATEELQQLILGEDRRWPREWTPLQRDAALALARGHLTRGADGAEYATRLLRVAWRAVPEPPDGWRNEAGPLLVVACAVTQDAETAVELLTALAARDAADTYRSVAEQLRGVPPQDRLSVVDRLAQRLGQHTDRSSTSSQKRATPPTETDLVAWTKSEQHAVRGSAAWREARLERIRVLNESGNRDQARKLLKLTRLLASDGSDAWRAELDRLSDQLDE